MHLGAFSIEPASSRWTPTAIGFSSISTCELAGSRICPSATCQCRLTRTANTRLQLTARVD